MVGELVFVMYLVFFCGYVGIGKIMFVKWFIGLLMCVIGEVFCLFDKDMLYGCYSVVVMGVFMDDLNDCDSLFYLKYFCDFEY